MKTKPNSHIPKGRGQPSFPRPSAVCLSTVILCLLGGLLTARGQDPWLYNLNYPINTNASLGAPVSFRVMANTAYPPLRYQWQHEGTNLPAATNEFLVVTNLTVADAGGYMAWVSNAINGFTNSRTAILTVDPTFTQIQTGPVATDPEGGFSACWIDYDLDGNLDLIVARGGDGLMTMLVYHNLGDGTFTRVTTGALATASVRSYGVVCGDYDNDGRPDVFVPNAQTMPDMLFHNDGGGAFIRITTGPLVTDGMDSITGVWGDYNLDGFIDLFVTTWGNQQPDLFYRNNGNGTFRKLTGTDVGSIVTETTANDYATWQDVDNDGLPELYRNSRNGSIWSNQLWHQNPQGQFTSMPLGELLLASTNKSNIIWADYDNDGLLDAIIGGGPGLQLRLFRNLAGQGFTNVTAAAGLSSVHAFFGLLLDIDNDGWLDMFASYDTSDPDPKNWDVFRNNGDGTFSRGEIGSLSYRAWGMLPGDYDNDGFLDMLAVYGPGVRNGLFHHNGNTNHWLKVMLDGRASNRSGIGAKVRALASIGGRTFWQMREISGQGFSADNGLIAHFGLGDATNVTTLRIEWPSGIVQELQNVAPNQPLTVVESQGYTNAAPTFSDVTNGSGGLQLSFTEPAAGVRYILEASTNLVSWTKLMARTSTGTTAQFTDTGATNYTRRFYRLQVP